MMDGRIMTARTMIAASRHHAVISLFAALAIASMPIGVLPRLRSCTIRASTGKAVMLTDMPMNSAKERKGA